MRIRVGRDVRYDAFDKHHLKRTNAFQDCLRQMVRRIAEVFSSDLENLMNDAEGAEDLLNGVDDGMRTIVLGASSLDELVQQQQKEEADAELDRDIELGICMMVGDTVVPIMDNAIAETVRQAALPAVVRVQKSTRFIAECVVALRYVIGTPHERTRAAEAAAEKRMRKLLKDTNCRGEVVEVNMPEILDAYFSCDANARRSGAGKGRVSRWLLRLLGMRVAKPTSDC